MAHPSSNHLKAWFSNQDWTIRPNPVNPEPLINMVLLTLRTSLYQKRMKLFEPWSNRTVLRTVAGSHSLNGSLLLFKFVL